MRKGHLTARISKIYDLLERRTEMNSTDLAQELSEPTGTVSSCLSHMVKLGYLYRNNNLYDVRRKADPREVAVEIRKKIDEYKQIRKQKELNRSRDLFDEPAPKASKIELAVELLKSKGYKILAPVTEFKEI